MNRANGASPIIENPHNLALPDGAHVVLRAMFTTCSRVTIGEELAGGFSGSRVFVVHPIREDGLPELPAVVKLGPRPLVQQEWHAYRQHVQNRLPGVAAIQGPPLAPGDGGWAGLRYPLVGSGTFEVESLQQYYPQASADDLRYVMELRLFRQLGALWRFSHPAPNFSLQDSYDYLLPVNLLVRPTPVPDGTPAIDLDAENCRSHNLRAGDFVRLHGFVVSEVEDGAAQITLNLPQIEGQQPRSYRLRLVQGAVHEFEVGSVVQGLTGRILNTRLGILAAHALEVWGVGFEVDAEAFALSGGRSLPNPLARLPAVLAARPTVRLAAIHGDLNPQNILVDAETREVRLIDFADARQDHVLHDLLRLETGILTRLLPDALQEAGLPPEVVVALYERLAQEPQTTADGVAPALAKVTATLAAIRHTAGAYLYDADDWLEYWQGLTLYLLGAHKYANLSITGKKVAFLAAATTQQLLTQGALRTRQAPTSDARRERQVTAEESPPSNPVLTRMMPAGDPPAPGPSWRESMSVPWWLPVAVVLTALLVLLGALAFADNNRGSERGPFVAGRVPTRAPAVTSTSAITSEAPLPGVAAATPTMTANEEQAVPLAATPPQCTPRGANSNVVVLLDLSQSMHGAKLLSAIVALKRFIACLHPAAEIAVYTFAEDVQAMEPAGTVRDVADPLQGRLDNLFAGGESVLYDAVCQVMETIPVGEEGREIVLILLADGPDTASTTVTSEDEILDCIREEVSLYTIAYGPQADLELLARLAERGNGEALEADQASLDPALQSIPLP